MTDQIEQPDALTTLKARADLMGISYNANVGVDKLRERIEKELGKADSPTPSAELTPLSPPDYMRLVRVTVTPMDVSKRDYPGEAFSVSNEKMATLRRFVPFGVETHVEEILLNVIKDKQCMQLVEDSNAKVKGTKRKRLIPAYGVVELAPLTSEQLEDLAKSQRARQSIE